MLTIFKIFSKNFWKQECSTDFMVKNIKKQQKFTKKVTFNAFGRAQNLLGKIFVNPII